MPSFRVSVDRTSVYEVVTTDKERAIDLALSVDNPDVDEFIQEIHDETINATAEEFEDPEEDE